MPQTYLPEALRALLEPDLAEALGELIDGDPETLFDSSVLDFGDPYGRERAVLDALAQLHAGSTVTVEGDVYYEDQTVIPGSLVVRGNLAHANHLYVLGDLTVDGVVENTNPHCVLALGGTLRAHHLLGLRAYVHTREIEVDGLAAIVCYGVGYGITRLSARVVWLDDSWLATHDGDETETSPVDAVLELEDVVGGEAKAALQALVEGALPVTEDGSVEVFEFFAKLGDGSLSFRD